MRFLIKILLSSVVLATVSELGKRSSWVAAVLASLPLTSILALSWLYLDTKDTDQVIALSRGIFWAVLPSLLFFVLLPVFLKGGLRFPVALTLSCLLMALSYGAYGWALSRMGITI